MIDIGKDIDSLSAFKRNSAEFVRRLKKSKQPVVLTINGRAELVVQDAEAYQRLLEVSEYQETVEALREAFEDEGEGHLLDFEQVAEEIRKKHGLSR